MTLLKAVTLINKELIIALSHNCTGGVPVFALSAISESLGVSIESILENIFHEAT